MIPFLALVRKDLRLFFNDRKAVVVGLLVPIVLASFFGYLFGGRLMDRFGVRRGLPVAATVWS